MERRRDDERLYGFVYKMVPQGRGSVVAVDSYRMFIQSQWLTVDVVNKLFFGLVLTRVAAT